MFINFRNGGNEPKFKFHTLYLISLKYNNLNVREEISKSNKKTKGIK